MFRRRRLVVLVGLLVVVLAAVLGIRAAIGAIAHADDTLPRDVSTAPVLPPDPDDEPTGPPSEEELANPVDCRPHAVDLSIEMAATTIKEGASTPMPVTVTNSGQVPCLLDVGGAQIALAIYSGDDLVWTSQHCSTRGDRRILLDVDDQDTISFRWTGARSATGCPEDQPVAGAGTYRAVVTLLTADEQPEEIATVEQPFTVK